ncbi:fructosamine kinase family protein [Shivajiella indica]|uniref:Fructosamine kinase family protein n=1 Tax=Shivajiella indica TaxID=872115 RepID=A0ABW5B9Z5_9BACT
MFETNQFYESIFFLSFGKTPDFKQVRLISAGNVNQGVLLEVKESKFFLKVNFEPDAVIFEKEADGLNILRKNCPLKIPEVYHFGRFEERNFLLMEWIQEEKINKSYWEKLGEGLAQLHMASFQFFGYPTDNFIASLSQINSFNESWLDFFIESRLEPLIGKAYFEGLVNLEFLKKFRKIYAQLGNIFPREKPSLIHGDLWSGNIMIGQNGNPALIDPAVYFGHREMDLAFSKLFGGFDRAFYQSYQDNFPLDPGFEEREAIYNLYPLLVHVLLFGKSYLSGIERTVGNFQ